jgi:hypothetical protein
MKLGLTYKSKQEGGRRRHRFKGQHLIWAIKQMAVAPEKPQGEGTSTAPFRMASIGQWAVAAANKTTTGHDLYKIGRQWVERVPSEDDRGPSSYGDYVTAVSGPEIRQPRKPGDTLDDGYSNAGRARAFDSPKKGIPIYQTKYNRFLANAEGPPALNDKRMAKEARAILKGADISDDVAQELPGTVAALFLAEVARAPQMLPIGLMLLDLIEVGATYGRRSTKKTYTFERMMVESEKPPSNTRRFPLGGKHPMVRNGTIKEAKGMFDSFNSVSARSASIVSAWLGCYLSNDQKFTVKVRTPTKHPKLGQGVMKQFDSNRGRANGSSWNFYREVIELALMRRCATLDCMLSQGAQFVYADPPSDASSDSGKSE